MEIGRLPVGLAAFVTRSSFLKKRFKGTCKSIAQKRWYPSLWSKLVAILGGQF